MALFTLEACEWFALPCECEVPGLDVGPVAEAAVGGRGVPIPIPAFMFIPPPPCIIPGFIPCMLELPMCIGMGGGIMLCAWAEEAEDGGRSP